MPSKFTAYLHFSQEDMDKLVKLDPSINENSGSINQVISLAFRNFINGKYITKDQMKIDTELQNKKIEKQLEKYDQEIINLKIKNKLAMIHDLKVAPDKANDIAENRIPIEQVIGGTNEPPITNVNAGLDLYDKQNQRLECIDCGILFEIESIKELNHLLDAQMKYLTHISEKHSRPLTASEKESFKKLGVPV